MSKFSFTTGKAKISSTIKLLIYLFSFIIPTLPLTAQNVYFPLQFSRTRLVEKFSFDPYLDMYRPTDVAISLHQDGIRFAVLSANRPHFSIYEVGKGLITQGIPIISGNIPNLLCMSLHPNGQFLIAGSDHNVTFVWDLNKEYNRENPYSLGVPPKYILKGHSKAVTSVQYSNSGNIIATASADKTICLWESANGNLLQTIILEDDVTSLGFSSDDQFCIAGTKSKGIQVFSTKTGRWQQSMGGNIGMITSIAVNSKGLVLSGGDDHMVRIWDLKSGTNINTYKWHNASVQEVNFLEGTPYFISLGADKLVNLWNISDEEEPIQTLSFPNDSHSLTMSTNGKFLTILERRKNLHHFYELKEFISPLSKPVNEINSNTQASSMKTPFQLIKENENHCRKCINTTKEKGQSDECTECLAYLAAGYSLVKDTAHADELYRRLLLSDLSPQARHERLQEYAFYSIRRRNFIQADSLLDLFVNHIRSRKQLGGTYIVGDGDLISCFNLYFTLEKYEKLLNLLEDELLGTENSLRVDRGGEIGDNWNTQIRNLLFKTLLRTNKIQAEAVAQVAGEEDPEITLLRSEWLIQNNKVKEAEIVLLSLIKQMTNGLAESDSQYARLKTQYYTVVLKRLIELYDKTEQADKIEPLIMDLRKSYREHLKILSSVYTTAPMLQNSISYHKSETVLTDNSLTNEGPAIFNFVLKLHKKYPKLAGYAYDNALMLKSSEETQEFIRQLNGQKYSDNDLEILMEPISFKDIRRTLLPGEAAIEFVSFPYYKDHWSDSTIYAAMVMRYGDAYPSFTVLTDAKSLHNPVERSRDYPQRSINPIYGGNNNITSSQDFAEYKLDSDNNLYKLIWAPIADSLLGINTIYFSPSGYLNGVSFSALPIGPDSVLADKYRLHRLITTASIGKRDSLFLTEQDEIALIGNIKYETDSLKLSKLPKDKNVLPLPLLIPSLRKPIDPLPNTEEELSAIKNYFPKAIVLRRHLATEERLKALTKTSPKILHIATHGYYLPDSIIYYKNADKYGNLPIFGGWGQDILSYANINEPYLRSGLLLANAEYVWRGGQFIDGVEDGLLTSYEIANLRFPNTKLVVLSACDSGLGELRGNESVIGFQRAFKAIGVNNLIVSLWKVSDEKTTEFMKLFYDRCLVGKLSVQESFHLAQMTMRRKYPTKPYFWAGFTLIR
ncbi:CHAT domain-containing protein [Leadbetterella sp. DM7]|uniref:CHAT domain-containing protein n=1 Tax=Leadbetterella sp. DM7 TaxID=3235085 RepID=UPI00349E6774